MPWVRLHGVKDYLDMALILEKYPLIKQTFNIVPSLMGQVEDYLNRTVKDKFLILSYKPAAELTHDDKAFIRENFFSINKDKVIAYHPRYYDLYIKKHKGSEFNTQDYLDLQVWFNLSWIDPYFRESTPELRDIARKARFYSEEDKHIVLERHVAILEDILPVYKKLKLSGQLEVTVTPYYHPILPLLYNTKIAKEAYTKAVLPEINFSYPQDAVAQIDSAIEFYRQKFGSKPQGMWPSEEAVCEHIVPFFIQSGINWIVTDEAILFKSLKKKTRDTRLIYQPHLLRRKDGDLNIIFRDRNLSDLIGFVYNRWPAKAAVDDFMKHLENIAKTFSAEGGSASGGKDEDILVCLAMDGENAWEYYTNDGHDFLELLYQRLSEAKFLKTTTPAEYLKEHAATHQIPRLAAGSWIFAEFGKWIGNPHKVRAWECLALARQELEHMREKGQAITELAWKQIHIAEGSDWFWWYGENHADFDKLFRMHLSNFYTMIGKAIPEYLKNPI